MTPITSNDLFPQITAFVPAARVAGLNLKFKFWPTAMRFKASLDLG